MLVRDGAALHSRELEVATLPARKCASRTDGVVRVVLEHRRVARVGVRAERPRRGS